MNEFSIIQNAHAASEAAAESPAAELEIPGKVELPAETASESLTTESAGSEEAHEGGLEINPYTVAFQVLNFVILIVVLNLILYKPLTKLLRDREKKIRDGVENAEKAEGMLRESHLIREDMIKSAKIETQTILERARATGEKVKADIMGEAQKEADHVVKSGHTLIDMERQKAAEDFKGLAVDLILKTTEKVLREKLRDQKDTQLIKESLNSLT